ncbi:cysteine hydrolase family protein [Thermoanaerobacter pentosaceus]|uniref:Nicotinamidase-related amidase n=1 Tax=Thermoanaerobacter pentosaceus TaxID=694059 RepID=A0ABT9M332_9THEO|nr:isochorismatase family cysteine hydrolase [Thermoanaerobacter pentosaceus]MDP9750470.1 nicotinamidase-related amidase [Thermoanaerobacter pentosaceus]
MNFDSFLYNTRPFLNYLFDFYSNLDNKSLSSIIYNAGGPQNVSILIVDMVNGFCKSGPLSSPRIAGIIEPIKNLIKASHKKGIKNVFFINDSHTVGATEFSEFPQHCVRGSFESEIVDELKETIEGEPVVFEKNSLNAFFGGELEGGNEFLKKILDMIKEGKSTFIVVGDCTDLCVYQTAMSIKMIANANNLKVNVIVPENCVETYDASVKTAQSLKIMPHDGDLIHTMFLYHMKLNGIEVVKELIEE